LSYEKHKARRKEYAKKHYVENRERILASTKINNQKRKEEIRVYHANYYLMYKKEIRAQHANYYKNNCEQILKRNHLYYKENREEKLAYCKEYRRTHHKEVLAMTAAWVRLNPKLERARGQRRRARAFSAKGIATVQQIAARWEMFGNRCYICGGVATATDHVKPLSKGGANWPCNLRPICTKCNSKKGNKWPYSFNEKV